MADDPKDIGFFLGQITARLDAIDEKLDTFTKTHGDHEVRIRSLEDTRSRQAGVIAAIGTGVTLVVNIGIAFVKKFF